jgi:hypothetical protein
LEEAFGDRIELRRMPASAKELSEVYLLEQAMPVW